MRKYIYFIFSFIATLQLTTAFATDSSRTQLVLKPDSNHPRIEQVISYLLTNSHYQKKEINDSLSADIFSNYIKILDGNRVYFLQSDINSFQQFEYQLDDAIRSGQLSPAYTMFNRFIERFEQRMTYVNQILDTEFDFTLDEYYRFDRREEPWAANLTQMDSIWHGRIKNQAIQLKLAGKDWPDIAQTLRKRYANMQKRINQSKSEDVFQFYTNAFAETFDPHTAYMSPKTSDDFKIRMSHSLEGIGALLSTEDDYTKVVEIVPGGPADKSKLLHAEDKICGVAQGENGELIDVIGWRIDDVVDLIRGPKETVVRLQILPADASVESPMDTIQIIRDKVRLADRAAKSDTLEIEENGRAYKIGVIEIPDFYFDYDAMRKGDPNFSSTSNDVKRLLGELKSAGVEGIIIDLRDNGGGFLTEAINLTGLFIEDGPVVQVRQTNGRLEINKDEDPHIYYDGPLAVLVNRFSASASEIFAAAIQDYNRGIIVGNQSFGKGTVQNIVGLNRFFPRNAEKLGQIKMTIAKFYRVNGGSTQNLGVIPNIEYPSQFHGSEVGERNMPNSLLWDEIASVNFNPANKLDQQITERLTSKHIARTKSNSRFKYLLEDIQQRQKESEKKLISLNEEKRRERRKLADQRKEKRKKELDDLGENISESDLYITETAHILSDFVELTN